MSLSKLSSRNSNFQMLYGIKYQEKKRGNVWKRSSTRTTCILSCIWDLKVWSPQARGDFASKKIISNIHPLKQFHLINIETIANENPSGVGLVVLAWDLEICSLPRSQVRNLGSAINPEFGQSIQGFAPFLIGGPACGWWQMKGFLRKAHMQVQNKES